MKMKEITDAAVHLLFPHICKGCSGDQLSRQSEICFHCLEQLPNTRFELIASNPVEKIFWGRLPVFEATAQYYFNKGSLMQHLLHELKYRGARALGLQLGKMMGIQLEESGRFRNIQALIPLPLFPSRERQRGYNQSALLCEGIQSINGLPILSKAIERPGYTQSQTNKGRIERWKNISGKFELIDSAALIDKEVLLVDDVITTGATLEACSMELLKAPGIRVSIAACCIADN